MSQVRDLGKWITGNREDDITCDCGAWITYAALRQRLTDGSSSTYFDWECECGAVTEFEVEAIPEFHAISRKSAPPATQPTGPTPQAVGEE